MKPDQPLKVTISRSNQAGAGHPTATMAIFWTEKEGAQNQILCQNIAEQSGSKQETSSASHREAEKNSSISAETYHLQQELQKILLLPTNNQRLERAPSWLCP